MAADKSALPMITAQLKVTRDPADAPLDRYFIPDLRPSHKLIPTLNTKFISTEPGIKLIVDRTGFRQNETSLAQVGQQNNLLEVRSASIDLFGDLGPNQNVRYKVGIEYNGFDVDPASDWAITDFNLNFALPRLRTTVSAGKLREDFGYEIIGSTSTLAQSERILSPFIAPYNPGIKLATLFGPRDSTRFSIGIFKDDWGDGDGKIALSARLSRLVIDDPDNRRFLHLGVALRHSASNGTIRYRARPGVNAADNFVDTDNMPARAATNIGLEANWSEGPWSLMAERVTVNVDAPDIGNPNFSAFYLIGSWVITGESRRYDRSKGVPGRIIPQGRWGAPELLARYAIVDMNDGQVLGGRYERLELGVNWWATSRWKLGLLYGDIKLDRFSEIGHTQSLVTRLQWVN